MNTSEELKQFLDDQTTYAISSLQNTVGYHEAVNKKEVLMGAKIALERFREPIKQRILYWIAESHRAYDSRAQLENEIKSAVNLFTRYMPHQD